MGSLSEIQQQLILGCVLGDGYLRKKTNAHLQITHSIKQKEYVDWKYQILKDIVITPPKAYQGNANRIGYRFFTRSIPELTEFYNTFYQCGKKIIPDNLVLSPLSLAVLYMDDGSKTYRSSYFNCQQFDLRSQNNLIKSLAMLGIESRLNKDKKYLRIRTLYSSTPTLRRAIMPHIIKSMRYKIPI